MSSSSPFTALRRSILPTLACCLAFGLSSVRADNSTETFFGLDLNKNHLSEFFELLYPAASDPNGDADGDGQTNMQESASGTNPTDGRSRLDFSDIATTPSQVVATFPTVRGKVYQVQMSTSLSGSWANEGSPHLGDGTPLVETCPSTGSRMFLRLEVKDTDTDSDGVSDWEEYMAGTNPLDRDTEGNGISDFELLSRRLNLPTTVDVIAQDAVGSEGGDAMSFRLMRRGNLNPMTVNFTWSGTAANGVDYTTPPTSAVFGFGETAVTVTVTPLADALAESPNETVVLALASGAGYTVGNLSSATGVIVPAASGTGLTGRYYDNSSSTYNASYPPPAAGVYANGAINFLPADLKETKTDATINYSSITAGNLWVTLGAKPSANFVDADYHSIVWSGKVEPQFSETYTFFVTANAGSRLWVNGVKLTLDTAWATSSEVSGTIALQAGKQYDVVFEWHDETNTSIAELRWSSPSQAKQIIPSSRLYPSLPPVVDSSPFAVAFIGGPFSYQTTATNLPTGFAAGGLPNGLTINSTGLISGIPNGTPGLFFVNLAASNGAGTGVMPLSLLVIQSGGGLTRDVWNGTATPSVVDIPLATAPAATSTTTDFSSPVNAGDNFSERLSGYITAPTTGTYTFFLTTADENAELWVSADNDPSRLLKRSFLTNTSAGGNYGVATSQKSLPVKMLAGQKYFVETRRKETTGNDQLVVGWLRPGQTGSAPSETIPGYVLTPASTGAAQTGKGTLYVANLTPQSGATTFGNGTGVLLVNEAQTSATLSYTYSGLTGPITNQHIHDGASLPGPVGAILYDIDVNTPDSFGVYTYDFVPTGNHTVADIVNAITTGTAYLNLHTAAYPNGEIKGFFQKASGARIFVPPAPPAAEALPAMSDDQAVRFLTQASMGAKRDTDGQAPFEPDSIENVKALGFSGWIDEQLNLSAGNDPELTVTQTIPNPDPPNAASVADPAYVYTPFRTVINGNGPMATFVKDYYTKFPRVGGLGASGTLDQSSSELFKGWWKFAVTNPDQLRQRVAFALSQILVVSEQGVFDENARAMAHYYDVLNYYAFTNFRTLLEKITLNVPMGRYLDMFRNKKASTTSVPNENYAREIMQLFSIGLNRIHPDGSLVLNAQGFPVPTYAQDQVVGLAHVFTGWSFNGDTASFNGSPTNYMLPMTPFPTQHSPLEKSLLDNTVIPALSVPTAQSTADELQASIDLIFHHPNVGPFISRQLIQRMVTANPSLGYIYRVATVFADNGSGVRGDMKAVVKAILLDPEARYASFAAQTDFGHLKEPVLRVTQVLRTMRGYSNSALYNTVNQLPHAQVATQANIDLSIPLPVDVNNLVFVDNTRLWPGMRVLVKNQTNAAENGLYDYTSPTALLARSASADSPAELNGAYVRVSYGTSTGKTFRMSPAITTLGTDAVTWVDNSGSNNLVNQWNVGETGSGSLFQTPLKSPTVFNFYEPDYRFPGATGNAKLYGPEFQILSETSVVNTTNLYYNLTHTSFNDLRMEFVTRPTNALQLPYPWPVSSAGVYTNDLDNPEIAIAGNTTALLDRLNTLLLGGRMSATLRGHLNTYINTMASATTANKKSRVQDAVYLIMLSNEYSIQK